MHNYEPLSAFVYYCLPSSHQYNALKFGFCSPVPCMKKLIAEYTFFGAKTKRIN